MTSTLLLVAALAAQSPLEWKEYPPLPDPLGFAGPFAGVSDGALIVAGGANFPGGRPWDGHPKVWHDRIFVLSEPGGRWRESGKKLPRPIAYGVALTHPTGIVCLGGGDAGRHTADAFLMRLEESGPAFQPLPPMPRPAAFFCGALLGDTVYVAGGREQPDSPTALKTFWSLDLSAHPPAWKELAPWKGKPRMLATAAAQDGSILLFGGTDLVAGERKPLRDCHRYRPGRGWTRIADLPRAAIAAPTPAPTLGTDHALVIGGDDGTKSADLKDAHPGFPPDILAYHTVTDTWRVLSSFPKDKAAGVMPPVTTVAVRWNDAIVLPSGEVRPGVRTPRVAAASFKAAKPAFQVFDYAVLVVYLLSLVLLGVWCSRRAKSTDDFFRAGGRIPWWAAGLSIYGTTLSAITYMAIPAFVYRTDWVYFLGNVMILAACPVVIFLYLPFYRRLNVTSAYEYLEKRFNGGVRTLGSLAFLLMQLGRMGIVVYLPALALATVTGVNIYLCVVLMGVLATIYTALGGIEAVVWTDVVQVVVLLGGAVFSLALVVAGTKGGLSGVFASGWAAGKFHAVNPGWDMATTALWVVIVGKLLEQLVPYTADQAVVQRYLTTADEKKAARAIWTNGILVIPGSAVFFLLGTGLWAFYRSNPDHLNPAGRHDDIFAWFIVQELPPGLAGLVIAGIFAASMSSLDSSMNSMATAITTDFYRRFREGVSDSDCLRFARIVTFLLGATGTATALLMAGFGKGSMWDLYVMVVGLFGSGLAGLFLAGIFTRRASGGGMIVGFFASALILFLVKQWGGMHFFLYAAVGILSCALTGWLASLALPGPRKDLQHLTLAGSRE